MNPRWAAEDAAAQHVGVSVKTLKRWRAQGLVTAYRFGARLIRYDLNELDAMPTNAGCEVVE